MKKRFFTFLLIALAIGEPFLIRCQELYLAAAIEIRYDSDGSLDDDYSVQSYPYQSRKLLETDMHLKDCEYSFLHSVSIPGMPSTREEDARENRITDTGQCLQGICLAEEYLLVSSYSSGDRQNLGCVHVFERETGDYLATLGMKGKSHLGGLAFDGEYVWVCHSDSKALERVPFSFIRRLAAEAPRALVDVSSWFEECRISNTPSCIAYYDGRLWVATHTKAFCSRMKAYRVTKDGLKEDGSYRIPEKVQGIAFDESGRVYVSSSYGRKNSSYLKIYKSAEQMNRHPGFPVAKIEMPPCSEEIDMDNGLLYVLFESAGEKYFEGTDGKGRSISPIDKVLSVPAQSLTASL